MRKIQRYCIVIPAITAYTGTAYTGVTQVKSAGLRRQHLAYLRAFKIKFCMLLHSYCGNTDVSMYPNELVAHSPAEREQCRNQTADSLTDAVGDSTGMPL